MAQAAVAKSGAIGAISVSGDASVTATADTAIGNVAVGGLATLTLEVTQASATIGNVSGTGTGNHSVTITGLASTVVGDVTFGALDDGDAVTLVVNDAEAIGNITIEAATAKNVANLALDANELVTIGDIVVDGELTLTTDLINAETIGAFDIGSFAAVPAVSQVIGAGVAQTAQIGFISIGADIADNAGAQYVFQFDDYNGEDAPSAVTVATIDGVDYSTNDMDVNTPLGGIRLELV